MNPLSLFYTVRSYVEAYAGLLGRRFVSIIWAAALCILVWFYGSYLALGTFKPLEPALHRILAIGAIVAIWIGWLVWSTVQARRADAALIDDLAGDGRASPEAEARAEVDALRTRLKEGMVLLRKVVGRRFGTVYELPWYLMMGAPGSGKTTSLTQSGLKFPLGEAAGGEPVGGVGGTRNCNWWFSEEAIIIDTAGRYTTHGDLAGADKAGWNGFLGLLRKHRPSQPVNGVLVTLSIPDLLDRDPAERLEEIRSIRQRLSEMDETLRARVPVYVVLTKADLLDGFVPFFDGLSRHDREQVWGTTFDLETSQDPKDLPERFRAEFDLLTERVAALLLERLQQEPDIETRSAIFRLPARMAALREPMHEVLAELCSQSKFVSAPLLRGVYLASGTQAAAPALAGASTARPLHRSYFLSRLFHEVVFGEAALVSRDRRLTRRNLLVRRVAFAGAAAVALVVLGGWVGAYLQNRSAIAEAEETTARFAELSRGIPVRDVADADFLRLLPALDAMAGATSAFRERPALGFDFGLDQGGKVEASHRAAYGNALNAMLLPRLLVHLQERLQDAEAGTGETFDALKLYGMLGGLGPLDRGFVGAEATAIFDRLYPGEGRRASRESLVAHVEALVARPLANVALDERLIAQARTRIAEQSLASRTYDILRESPEALALTQWSPAGALGSSGEPAFARRSGGSLREGIPGLYTARGFQGALVPNLARATETALGEDWVRGRALGASASSADVSRDALGLYLSDFENRWRTYLADLEVRPARDLAGMTEVTRILSAAPYVLTELSRSVAEATHLAGGPAIASGDAAAADAATAPLALLPVDPAALPDPYAGLREALTAPAAGTSSGEETPSTVAALQPRIEALYAQLSRASASSAEVAAIFDVDGKLSEANQALVQEARRLPAPVDGWVGGLTASVDSLAVSTARTSLDAEWQANGARVCREAVAGRYPFDAGAEGEVAIDDFTRVFGPKGVFQSFFDERLKPFVDTSSNPWRWRGTFGVAGEESEALAQFARARAITDAFFTKGEEPGIGVTVTPTGLSDDASAVIFEIEGERVVYFHGPVQSKSMVFPRREGASLSRVIFQPNGWTNAISQSGPWSALRIFDEARTSPVSDDRFRARFAQGRSWAEFDVQAGSVLNPFATDALTGFRCPERL